MSETIEHEIPGVTHELPQSLEEVNNKISRVSLAEKQLYTNFLTRTAHSAIMSADVIKIMLDNMSEELALHREHELQIRAQLITESSLQTYIDALTAMRLRQKEAVAKRAEEQAAKSG